LIPSDTITPGEILDEFCVKLQDINTTIPDPVILHYMKQSGFIANDPKLIKIISLASQKFISEIVNDCMQYSKLKTSTSKANAQSASAASSGAQSNDKKQTNNSNILTLDDLSLVLQEHGINVKKPMYFI
jgi:transcription initiation factor TFIID subunit 10